MRIVTLLKGDDSGGGICGWALVDGWVLGWRGRRSKAIQQAITINHPYEPDDNCGGAGDELLQLHEWLGAVACEH